MVEVFFIACGFRRVFVESWRMMGLWEGICRASAAGRLVCWEIRAHYGWVGLLGNHLLGHL